jgi:lipoprotein-anchoring transpeptidase ErfK/SrfK
MQPEIKLGRRTFVLGGMSLTGLALAGCATNPDAEGMVSNRSALSMYDALPDEKFPIPAVDLNQVDPIYYRTEVKDPTGEQPGTILVDTKTFYLYLVGENNRAMRYGVGLGRAGFEWAGRGRIAWKRQWPTWTPPASMIERQPELEQYSAANGGMSPGLGNPLGARALYIFQGGKDTLYRLHGTAEAYSIGKAVSSGCVRLLNQDVIDLYQRVPSGSQIMVV